MRLMIALIAVSLLAGCGPSAQQRRACEMYFDADGAPRESESPEHYRATKSFREHMEMLRASAQRDRQPEPTDDEIVVAVTGRMAGLNGAARQTVAHRLGLTLREVQEALDVCPAYLRGVFNPAKYYGK